MQSLSLGFVLSVWHFVRVAVCLSHNYGHTSLQNVMKSWINLLGTTMERSICEDFVYLTRLKFRFVVFSHLRAPRSTVNTTNSFYQTHHKRRIRSRTSMLWSTTHAKWEVVKNWKQSTLPLQVLKQTVYFYLLSFVVALTFMGVWEVKYLDSWWTG